MTTFGTSLALYIAKQKRRENMKNLIIMTLMILSVTTSFAAEVGENDTNCSEMIQANRNTNRDVVVNEESAERDVVAPAAEER
jgi:hypothetical protein